MKINVVLVTYNRKKCLGNLLGALSKQTKKIEKVFIFDNNSNDGTIDMLYEKGYISTVEIDKDLWTEHINSDYDVFYYRSSVNSGGSGGFNQVIKEALNYKCDYIWIMDDDVEPDEKCLEVLCDTIDDNHTACIPNRTDNYYQDSVWVEFDLKKWYAPGLTSSRKTKINHPLLEKKYEVKDFPFEGPLISYDIMKRIGPSDSSYFIICDDTDYCINVQKYTKIYFCTDAILHRQLAKYDVSSESNIEIINWKKYYAIRNYIAFMKKNGQGFGAKYLNIFFNLIYWNLKAIKTKSIKNILNVNRAIWDGAFNRMGKTVEPGSF